MNTIANMTPEELVGLIQRVLDQRLEQLLGVFAAGDSSDDERPPEAVYASIEQNMWTPPPDAPSTTELVRAERER